MSEIAVARARKSRRSFVLFHLLSIESAVAAFGPVLFVSVVAGSVGPETDFGGLWKGRGKKAGFIVLF